MKNNICLSFFYREPLVDIDFALRLITILEEYEMLPTKYGISPSSKKVEITPGALQQLLFDLWPPFVEQHPITNTEFITLNWLKIYKTGPKYWGGITRNGGENAKFHSEIYFHIEGNKIKDYFLNKLNDFTQSLIDYAKCDLARVQFYSSQEIFQDRTGKQPQSILSFRQLAECLPDLYNITVWGKPYIEFFGKEKLLTSPCYKVEELPSGTIWMQLAPDVYNESGSWTAIKDVREKVKAHLNNKAFYDASLHKNITIFDLENDPVLRQKFLSGELIKELYKKNYKVPEFDLSEIRKPLILPEDNKPMGAA